jgi:hypothetical protein
MQVLQEITVWPDNTPNHVYHVLDNGKLAAFDNGKGLVKFDLPKLFDRRGRKFKVLKTVKEYKNPDVKYVTGSNGKVYSIVDGRCSCPGFTFRGSCKHVQ